MPEFDTQSERDFYDFCRRQNWEAEKLEESKKAGVRTPDFLVKTQTGYEFIAEITEFEPEEPLQLGEVRARGHTLGNPIRAKINDKKRQIKNFADKYPTLIVICGGFDHLAELDAVSFDSALYGELTTDVIVPHDPSISPRIHGDMRSAGRRFFGKKHNTSISAVAALDRRPHTLRIYHNMYAKNPLETARTSIETCNVQHFIKADANRPGWERLC